MTINRDVWLKALADAKTQPVNDHDDAITSVEFADLIGLDRSTARRKLNRLVALGKATVTRKWIPKTSGGWYPAPAYRLVEVPDAEPRHPISKRHPRRRRAPRSRRRP